MQSCRKGISPELCTAPSWVATVAYNGTMGSEESAPKLDVGKRSVGNVEAPAAPPTELVEELLEHGSTVRFLKERYTQDGVPLRQDQVKELLGIVARSLETRSREHAIAEYDELRDRMDLPPADPVLDSLVTWLEQHIDADLKTLAVREAVYKPAVQPPRPRPAGAGVPDEPPADAAKEKAPEFVERDGRLEEPKMEEAINALYRARHKLVGLRAKMSDEQDQQTKDALEKEIAQGETFLIALEAAIRKAGARGELQKARLEHDIVVEELFRTFKDSGAARNISPEQLPEIRQERRSYSALLNKILSRVIRVGVMSGGLFVGDVLVAGGMGMAGTFIGVLLGYLSGTSASHLFGWWNEAHHRVGFAQTIFKRMTTQNRGEKSSYERLHRILLDNALDENRRATEINALIHEQYVKLDPRYQLSAKRILEDTAAMGAAGGLLLLLKQGIRFVS